MFSRLILCVSPDRLVAGHWRLGRLKACEAFLNDREGHKGFRSYLQKYARTPVYLMVDAVEEDFRIETLPHTAGAARREILARKLGQHYRNTQFRAAQFVGREHEKRKDDRFLFMALNNAGSITPWLSSIEELHLPLAGIYLLATVSQFLLEDMKLKAPDLLLTIKQNTGMRQTYFHNGKLRLSRLTLLAAMEQSTLAELLMEETEKTRLYLLSQRLIKRETRLRLMYIGMGEEINRQLDSGLQGFASNAMDVREIARYFGLRHAVLDQFPELLHMQALARHVPEVNLALPMQIRTFYLRRLRNAINFGSLALLLGGAAITAYLLMQAADHDRRRASAQEQTARQEMLYRGESKNSAETVYSGSELKVAVELDRELADTTKNPEQLMQVVSKALDGFPEIRLDRLRWTLAENPDIQDGDNQLGPDAHEPALPSSRLKNNSGLYEIGFVEGEIGNFSGDYRAAMDSVARLTELLGKNKAVEQVIIVRQPVNTSSLDSLQGSTLDEQARQLPTATFKLKVLLKQGAKA